MTIPALRHVAMTLAGAVVFAAISAAFAWGFCHWWDIKGETAQVIFLLYAAATLVALVLCLAGQLLGVSSHAFYVIASGLVFLGLDLIVWQRFGIMPSSKFLRNGFAPAAVMALFAGAVYRVIAVPAPATRYEH